MMQFYEKKSSKNDLISTFVYYCQRKQILFFKIISQIEMSSTAVNVHQNGAIDNNKDELEFDFKEHYSREKTLELRDIYIP